MEPETNKSAMPVLCGGNCGFYGSPATDGLCSKCFKDALKRKQDPARQSPTSSGTKIDVGTCPSSHSFSATTSTAPTPSINAPPAKSEAVPIQKPNASLVPNASSSSLEFGLSPGPSASSSPSSCVDSDSSAANMSKKSNRCQQCNKKVGFTGFECRCGQLFCGVHRYSDMHQCTFDYKAHGAQEIRQNNPVVKNEKIQKL